MADVEKIKSEYEPKIIEILEDICTEAKSRDYECGDPDEMHDEEYKWSLFLAPKGAEEEAGVDVSIAILESEFAGDDPGGVAFSLDVVGYEGEIIGGLTPYNYSSDLWVPRDDDDAVEARWNLFNAGIDVETVVDSIDEFVKKRAASPRRPRFSVADLDLINRHRAKLGMRPLDPVASGWTPDDVAKEARYVRSLNPPPRVSLRQAVVSTVLTGIGVAGAVYGARTRRSSSGQSVR